MSKSRVAVLLVGLAFATQPAVAQASTLGLALTGLGESHSVWRETSKLARLNRKERNVPIGTTYSFWLSESARVTFTFDQHLTGRTLRNGRCALFASRKRHTRKCPLSLHRATFAFAGHQGPNTVIFQGWLSASSKLRPGRYSLVVAATAGGKSSRRAALRFTIAKPKRR